MKIFAYARKSTEGDERQVQSIQDQITWINDNVGNNAFKLFKESKSAKDPDKREQFKKMLSEIEKTKGEVFLYCWKLDRLSRNPVDSGMIQYLMQKGKIDKVITNGREYNPVDSGLLMSVESGMSNQFILDMVKNVERGMKSKVLKGGCIQNVPFGYINNKSTKEADIDPIFAPYVKEVFKLRSKGKSCNDISGIMYEKGMRGIRGGKVGKSAIDAMIKNPFYIGLQKFQGKLHKSLHEKLVTTKLWNEVNKIKRGYKAVDNKIDFPLKGIVKSYHTKKPLIPSWKKKKYVYYSTDYREENLININQDHIIEAFGFNIDKYVIPDTIKGFLRAEITNYYGNYYKEIKIKRTSLIKNINNVEIKSDRIFDLLEKGTITDEKYKTKENELIIYKEQLEEELKNIQSIDTIILSNCQEALELLFNVQQRWINGDKTQKMNLIKLIVLELSIDNKKQLYIQENELFESIRFLDGYKWQPIQGETGTISPLTKYLISNSRKVLDNKDFFRLLSI